MQDGLTTRGQGVVHLGEKTVLLNPDAVELKLGSARCLFPAAHEDLSAGGNALIPPGTLLSDTLGVRLERYGEATPLHSPLVY